MQEKFPSQIFDAVMTSSSPRMRLYDNFINSVKMDISKCIGFALAFYDTDQILEIVQNTFDKYLNPPTNSKNN